MSSYDEESSSDGELDVQTNVTLGYATDDITGDDISHAGGHPTWIDDKTKPPAGFAQCKVCNNNMSLLLQLQADLQQHFPEEQRRLFIWCCRRKPCSKKPGSVRAFREVKKAKTSRKPKPVEPAPETKPSSPPINLGNQLFGGSSSTTSGNANPFSTSSTPSNATNPFSTGSSIFNAKSLSDELAAKPPQPPTQSFADKLKISSPPAPEQPNAEPWPAEDSFPPPFPSFYLDAEAEYLEQTPAPTAGPSNSRITELEDEPGTSSSSSSAERDLYESPHDKTFEHFTRILAQNPEQILRYEFKGTPLLYSSTDRVAPHFVLPGHSLRGGGDAKVKTSGPVKGIPSCQYCGAARAFEMQLVPYMIYELEKDNEEAMKLDGGEGMEWGTIIVGTCSKNCGDEESGRIEFREEWTGVQWEEGGIELKQKR